MICKLPDCDRDVMYKDRQICQLHYQRWWRNGSYKTMQNQSGMSTSSEYRAWFSLIQRCTKPEHKQYKNYGGRGITVCERWLYSLKNFYEDMGECPTGKQIDREDNDGNYEPQNCRWVTPHEQSLNRRMPTNNTSGFIGVNRYYDKWMAGIKYKYKRYHIGIYLTKKLAVMARNEYIIKNKLPHKKQSVPNECIS